MAIFLNENSTIIVQGMTGSEGQKHTRRMLASGANVVGGVNARKAGTTVDFDGTSLPVFASVADAMNETGANVTVGFVPPAFTKDSVIEAIDAQIPLSVVITEIGGDAEERAAAYIQANVTKPVVGYVAGFTAPEGKTMGHAGAIVSGSSGTAQAKKEALEAAGVRVGKTPSETARLMRELLA